MRWSVSLILLFLVGTGYCQRFPSEFWHEGKIVLETGDTLRGNVKYDLDKDVLQFERQGRLESYTARKAVFFEIFDQTTKRYRQFYSLPYTTPTTYKAPIFFELLTEGRMTLLCREAIVYKTYTNSMYYYGSSSRLVLEHRYFLLKENGTIELFAGKKGDLIDLMGTKGPAVEKYMKMHKLDLNDKFEFAQIVSYYNSI